MATVSIVQDMAYPLRIYFCAWPVAGVRTQYENVRSVATEAGDLDVQYVEVSPYKAGGLIERLPLLGNHTRGSLRSFVSTWPLFTARGIDAIWTQVDTPLFPYLATRARLAGIPYVISTDATTAQVESFAEYELGDEQHPSLKHRLRDCIAAYCYQHAAYVLPWSRWAASAIMHQFHIPEQRIRVVPPGVDLRAWPARETVQRRAPDALPRLLFVGGDFARKGGPLLLDVFRASLGGRCELHLVTKEPLENEPGVFVYRDLGPNDPRLHHLYETADALVLPTRADCFSLASIEAMATGIPVITCGVGGIPEIVENGASGWLVPVGDGAALYQAIDALLANPTQAEAMGQRGRAIVEQRFDAAKNTRTAFELLRSAYSQRK
ncbi:MAG TPA: glycosyltransferase family 4 protein [Ktedonobacterales bacterium]